MSVRLGVPAGAWGLGSCRRGHRVPRSYLHGVLGVCGHVHTALAYGVGAHPDVLLDLVAIGEAGVVPV